MTTTRVSAALLVASLALSAGARAQTLAEEQVTGTEFPTRVVYEHQGRSYDLHLTGLAARRVLFFNVYGMAHYVQAGARPDPELPHEDRVRAVLSDEVAKQVTMEFVRDLGGTTISDALVKSIKLNSEFTAIQAAEPSIERFAAAIRHDVRKGERFTVRWLPGGVTVSAFNGVEVLTITDPVFARALWSMWFGERPVVDPVALLQGPGENPW